jgi:hypothetical protein
MAGVGILIPQVLWCADFLSGGTLLHMTGYMFDSRNSLFLRSLPFFHGWLPSLIVFLMARLGYESAGAVGLDGVRLDLLFDRLFFPPSGRRELGGFADPPERGLRVRLGRCRPADLAAEPCLPRRLDAGAWLRFFRDAPGLAEVGRPATDGRSRKVRAQAAYDCCIVN